MSRKPFTQQQLIAGFWEKVQQNTLFVDNVQQNLSAPCWPWLGNKDRDGYGRAAWRTKSNYVRAHRLMWELQIGPIPPGLFVLHRCDNPPCVNPWHLFLGTAKDNAQDALKKKRNYVGEKCPFYGRKHSAESLRRMSAAKLGKPHTPEHIEKIRRSCIGLRHSEESRLRHSEAAKRRWAAGGKKAFGF